jgi:sporulation related protein
MAAKDRRGGGRNWVPGLFAAFWILLAVFSGAYLFRIITEPQPHQTESAAANPAATLATSTEAEPVVAPPPRASAMSADQAEALIQTNDAKDKEISELKAAVSNLSGQVSDLSRRLKPLEKVLGPVAALPSSTAVTISPPSEESLAPAENPPEPRKPTVTAERSADEMKPVNQAKPAEKPSIPAKPPQKPAAEAKATGMSPSAKPKASMSPVNDDNASVSPPDEASDGTSKHSASPDRESSETSSEPATSDEPGSGSPAGSTETANLAPAPSSIPPGTTRFGIEIGSVGKQDEIRPMWRNLLTNHAALVAGLQARRVMAPDKRWRLIAGPFSSAAEATQACGLFKKANMSCEATVFAGDTF